MVFNMIIGWFGQILLLIKLNCTTVANTIYFLFAPISSKKVYFDSKSETFFCKKKYAIVVLVIDMDYRLYPVDSRLTYLLPTQISYRINSEIPTSSHELPIFSHWLYNFIRYGMTDDVKGSKGYFPRNPNYKMASLR